MSAPLIDLKFQFRYVKNGQAAGFGTGSGIATANGLMLGKEELPFDAIGDTIRRGTRLVLRIDPTNLHEKIIKYQSQGILVLEIGKPGAEKVRQLINSRVSRRRADETRRRITHMDSAAELRLETCGHCDAIIDASGKPKTKFIYCPYCENILAPDNATRQLVPAISAPGAELRVCDSCGYFGRIKGYTEFYFYFLLVVYGYRYKRIHVCDSCVDKIFWKNFLINAVFLLGLGPALWLKFSAGRGRTAEWKALAKGNSLATKNRLQEALPHYNEALQLHPDYPGFLLAEGVAYAQNRDVNGARTHAKRALDACSNYEPALGFLEHLDQAGSGAPSGAIPPIASPTGDENPLVTHR